MHDLQTCGRKAWTEGSIDTGNQVASTAHASTAAGDEDSASTAGAGAVAANATTAAAATLVGDDAAAAAAAAGVCNHHEAEKLGATWSPEAHLALLYDSLPRMNSKSNLGEM